MRKAPKDCVVLFFLAMLTTGTARSSEVFLDVKLVNESNARLECATNQIATRRPLIVVFEDVALLKQYAGSTDDSYAFQDKGILFCNVLVVPKQNQSERGWTNVAIGGLDVSVAAKQTDRGTIMVVFRNDVKHPETWWRMPCLVFGPSVGAIGRFVSQIGNSEIDLCPESFNPIRLNEAIPQELYRSSRTPSLFCAAGDSVANLMEQISACRSLVVRSGNVADSIAVCATNDMSLLTSRFIGYLESHDEALWPDPALCNLPKDAISTVHQYLLHSHSILLDTYLLRCLIALDCREGQSVYRNLGEKYKDENRERGNDYRQSLAECQVLAGTTSAFGSLPTSVKEADMKTFPRSMTCAVAYGYCEEAAFLRYLKLSASVKSEAAYHYQRSFLERSVADMSVRLKLGKIHAQNGTPERNKYREACEVGLLCATAFTWSRGGIEGLVPFIVDCRLTVDDISDDAILHISTNGDFDKVIKVALFKTKWGWMVSDCLEGRGSPQATIVGSESGSNLQVTNNAPATH